MENPRFPNQSTDPKSHFTKTTSFPHKFNGTDRRFAYSRQSSFGQFAEPRTPTTTIISSNLNPQSPAQRPVFSRSVSSIDIPPPVYAGNENEHSLWRDDSGKNSEEKDSVIGIVWSLFRVLRTGNRPMKRLFALISLNVAYSTVELLVGLVSGRVGLVSDAFHLTFGCGLLTFSLFAMVASRRKPDRYYTYGYKRLEVLSAFTNATAVSSIYVLFLGCGSTSCVHTR